MSCDSRSRSGPRRSSRANLPVRYRELAATVVLDLQTFELRRKRLLDEAGHRVLMWPTIEHGDSVFHTHQQVARDGHRRALDLTTRLPVDVRCWPSDSVA